MVVLRNTGGLVWTNCFLIADETAGEAVMFDAPDRTVGPLLQEARKRKWKLTMLLLTHGHFDHMADHAAVRKEFPDVKCMVHQLDEPKAKHPDVQTRMFGIALEIPPFKADAYVSDGQTLWVGSAEIRVIHTPGHAPGHVCYYIPQAGALVGGDLIIGGSVGRTDLPDSQHADLEASIRKIMELPGETKLLGGHGDDSTLATERRNNPFVGAALKGTEPKTEPNYGPLGEAT